MRDFNSSTRTFGAFHVAELARRAHVTPATIRYYTRVGLLDPGREPDNDYRCFSIADLRRVEFVRQAQSLGLTLGDIQAILDTIDHGESPCHQVRSLVEQRLVSIRERIADLQATDARISRALKLWKRMEQPAPADGEFCPLIEHAAVDKGMSNAALPERPGHRRSNHACHGHGGHNASHAARA